MKKCTLLCATALFCLASWAQLEWRHTLIVYKNTTEDAIRSIRMIGSNLSVVGLFDSAKAYAPNGTTVIQNLTTLKNTLTRNTTNTWSNGGNVTTNGAVYFREKIFGLDHIGEQVDNFQRLSGNTFQLASPTLQGPAKTFFEWGGTNIFFQGDLGIVNSTTTNGCMVWNRTTGQVATITSSTGVGIPFLNIRDFGYVNDTLYYAGDNGTGSVGKITAIKKGDLVLIENIVPDIACYRLFKVCIVHSKRIYVIIQKTTGIYELLRFNGSLWESLATMNVLSISDPFGITGLTYAPTSNTLYFSGRFNTVNGQNRPTGIVGYNEITNTSWDAGILPSSMSNPSTTVPSTIRELRCINDTLYAANNSLAATGIQELLKLQATILPLKLLSFTGKKEGVTAHITWKTTNEINVEYFTLERSTDGANFAPIVQIPALNITGEHIYNTNDICVIAKSYYRLTIVNKDGTSSQSGVVLLSKPAVAVQVFPNPVQHQFSIVFSTDTAEYITITVSSPDGKQMYQEKRYVTSGTTSISLSPQLHKGAYFIKLQSASTIVVKQIMKE